MSQDCHDSVPGLSRQCPRTVTTVSQDCHDSVPGLSRQCPRTVTTVSQDCHDSVPGLSRQCPRTVTTVSQDCHDSVPGLSRQCPSYTTSGYLWFIATQTDFGPRLHLLTMPVCVTRHVTQAMSIVDIILVRLTVTINVIKLLTVSILFHVTSLVRLTMWVCVSRLRRHMTHAAVISRWQWKCHHGTPHRMFSCVRGNIIVLPVSSSPR